MKMMFLLFFCCLSLMVFSQSHRLYQGDKLPVLKPQHALQTIDGYVDLQQYRGKLVILDFWSIYCGSCIAAFPELEAMQEELKDSLQIILVNSESDRATKTFLQSKKHLSPPQVPLITSDTLLHQLFAAEAYPAHVWISREGKILAITDGYSTTKENIKYALSGNMPAGMKAPVKATYGTFLPDSLLHKYIFFSCLKHYDPTIDIGNANKLPVDSGRMVRISANGASIVELLQKAFRNETDGTVDKKYGLDLQLSDSNVFVRPADPKAEPLWETQNAWDYELVLPFSLRDSGYHIMQRDILSLFPIKAFIEPRTVTAFVLERLPGRPIPISKGGTSLNTLDGSRLKGYPDSLRFLRNRPFAELVAWIKLWLEDEYPFEDSAGITANVDAIIRESSVNPLCLSGLQEDLKQAGLILKKTTRIVPVLSIKTKDD